MALVASKMPVIYERPKENHRSGLTIWQVPGSGIYRVREDHAGEFTVETLARIGWIVLITLERDEAGAPVAALQIWLDIQASVRGGGTDEEENAGD